MIKTYDNSKDYAIADSGNVFWNIFTNSTTLLYIYPGFFKWWKNKILLGLNSGKRLINVLYDKSRMCGYAVFKLGDKPKICTLQILPEYRRSGYGRELLMFALEQLKNPIITVSESQLSLYSPMLFEYGFEKVNEISDAYTPGMTEYVFKHI